MNFSTFKTILLAVLAMPTLCGHAQDLLARQAPIDKKLRIVDSLSLVKQIQKEKSQYPSYELYPTWNNNSVHTFGSAVNVPDSFRIDLTDFVMPSTSTKITSVFGPRRRRMHKGLDVKVYVGDTIRAAFDGRVRMVQYERRGYGKYVVIRHENGLETVYGHLSKQLVAENEYVNAGDVIGLGGNTGRSTGSHLHFETRFLGEALDPATLFDFEKQDVVGDTYLFIKGAPRYKRGKNTRTSRVASAASRTNGNTAPVPASGGGKYHKVRKGDTLGSIARANHTSVDALCKLNRITRRTVLRIGQVLRCS